MVLVNTLDKYRVSWEDFFSELKANSTIWDSFCSDQGFTGNF